MRRIATMLAALLIWSEPVFAQDRLSGLRGQFGTTYLFRDSVYVAPSCSTVPISL